MSEVITKIPGTTFAIMLGTEGKYYALFLMQGKQQYKSRKINILKGIMLPELPKEIETNLLSLLEAEQLFLNPVSIKRVVTDLLQQLPPDGQISSKDIFEPKGASPEKKVQDLIVKSDVRAGKKSVIEHTPYEKPKFDASASDIGKITLKTPKPLPSREEEAVSIQKEEKPILTPKIDYSKIEEKIDTLINEVVKLQDLTTRNDNEIRKLKIQLSLIDKIQTLDEKPLVAKEHTSVDVQKEEVSIPKIPSVPKS